MRSLLTVVLFFSFFSVRAGGRLHYSYTYTDNCTKIYQSYMSLHLREGHAFLLEELKDDPGNLMAVYLADYEDCIVLLLNCSREDYDQRSGNMKQRLELLDKGGKATPWYRFCKAGIYLHWAIAEVRFGDQYIALTNFRQSFSLLKENHRLYPDFEYNTVFAGLEEAVVGALPGSYKWMASVLGMRGDVKDGTQKLGAFLTTHTDMQPLYAETVLYYLYCRFYLLSDQNGVWDYLNSPRFSVQNNLLNTFVKVNIALDYRKSDTAIELLQNAHSYQDIGSYPVFDYQMGAALLTRNDTACVSYFLKYLKKNKSDSYIKDSWQKMAFAWYVNGNMGKALYCLQQISSQGYTRLDADKQAGRFADNKVWPLKQLLQARLFTDGGYYDRALAILKQINEHVLTSPADKAEYYFRLGRIYQETLTGNHANNIKMALAYYHSAINAGYKRHEQFAARAALQTGKIYEQLEMKNEAINKYKECLSMPAHDFQNAIDQQAKAGINRVSGE